MSREEGDTWVGPGSEDGKGDWTDTGEEAVVGVEWEEIYFTNKWISFYLANHTTQVRETP